MMRIVSIVIMGFHIYFMLNFFVIFVFVRILYEQKGTLEHQKSSGFDLQNGTCFDPRLAGTNLDAVPSLASTVTSCHPATN